MFAGEIRRKRAQHMRAYTHWRCRLDEMVATINGEAHCLWRAVDHEGERVETFVSKGRDRAAALKFMKKPMKRHGAARTITADGLRSYRAAMKLIGNACNFARRLRTLKGLTPYEHVRKIWTKEPHRQGHIPRANGRAAPIAAPDRAPAGT
jgi:transposase-like protein